MMATVAAGLAGGIAGDSTEVAGTGAQAGKNAAENNALSKNDEKRRGLRPAEIIDINPLFNGTAKILDENGDPLKGGGGIAKGGKASAASAGTKIVNPATNKVVTDHIIVPSGKAPKTSTPNSVYEVSRADGTKSITYYDDKGRMFSREDYGQQRTYGSLGYDANGKVPPHEHKIAYNADGKPIGKYYREIDKNGNAVGPWVHDK